MKKEFFTKDVTQAEEGSIIYKNRYWLCVAGDPKQALFFQWGRDKKDSTPQCNGNKAVTKLLAQNKMYDGLNAQVTFIETAFI